MGIDVSVWVDGPGSHQPFPIHPQRQSTPVQSNVVASDFFFLPNAQDTQTLAPPAEKSTLESDLFILYPLKLTSACRFLFPFKFPFLSFFSRAGMYESKTRKVKEAVSFLYSRVDGNMDICICIIE